ncbi:MAG TPA: hypothetical protein VFF69_16620 [Phycisphaerales bacterium]|nr:hypothetical protein [Phycisphaerales bacterium]
MKRDTLIQIGATLVLLCALGLSGGLASAITNSEGRHQLTYADTAEEGDPPEVSLGIAMGAFRGVFVNWLWFRATDLKEKGQYYEAMELARAITRLQPRFPHVWVFHAWNMAYNISVATQTPEERWQWVQAGIRLLRSEGIPANPNDMLLHKELAWIFLHKVAGITDDANQFYKRKLAEEWTIVLGEPPTTIDGDRSRQGAVNRFAAWLQVIADAPETPEELAAASPKAVELLGRLEEGWGIRDDMDILRRYAVHQALSRSVRRQEAVAAMKDRSLAFARLLDDPEYAEAWPVLISHIRRRVLTEEYNMEPARMIRYTRKYGPIDWRHPAAHALYWSARGVEESLTRWTEENKQDFDFINTDRVTIQSLQELYRSGEIFFNFFDSITGGASFYLAAVNPHFVESYGEVLGELVARSWADRAKRPYTVYSAGYENFLRDAVRFFYRRGQRDLAEKYYHELATYPGQNINNPYFKIDVSQPLDRFVLTELQEDRIRSAYVLVSEVVGSLQGAFTAGLLGGDDELFRKSVEWAGQAHRYYWETQTREVVAAPAGETRTGVLDPDFNVVAGEVFAQTVQLFPLDEAVEMYGRAPEPLRRYAYDYMVAAWKPSVDEAAAAGGRPFAELFPEPSGMEAHRAMLEARAKEAEQKRLDLEKK